jgi:hypothetical protein
MVNVEEDILVLLKSKDLYQVDAQKDPHGKIY